MAHVKRKYKVTIIQEKNTANRNMKNKFCSAGTACANNKKYVYYTRYRIQKEIKRYTNKAELDTGKGCKCR